MEVLKTALTLALTVESTSGAAPTALTDITPFGNAFNVSIRANASNSGAMYFRVGGASGDYIGLTASQSTSVTVRALSDIAFYSANGTEVADIIVDGIAAEYY